MGVESATFVNDFDVTLPTATDLRSQGDDHLRLVKAVLKASFPTASKAFYFPTSTSKSADFTVLAADMNKTFFIDTTGGIVNMTLPVLAAGDAGWSCSFMKSNFGTNPILVKPGSGTLASGSAAGLSATRRSIPNALCTAIWNGASFTISRATNLPIGSMIDLQLSSLPVGYEWPNGQVLASAATNYPDFNAIAGSGSTLDMRGRVGITLDNLGGSSAGRLAGGIIVGTAVGNTAGTDVVSLSLAQLPTGITSSGSTGSLSVSTSPYTLPTSSPTVISINQGTGTATFVLGTGTFFANASLTSTGGGVSASVTSNNTSGNAHSNLQPSIMCSKILIVE